MQTLLRALPWWLIALRTAAGPGLIWACAGDILPGWACAAVLVLALVSDFYDGYLARLAGSATAQLRMADSWADTIFWLCAAVALYLANYGIYDGRLPYIASLIGLEFVPDAIYLFRFGKQGCSHSYLSKLWGVSLVFTLGYGFITGTGGIPLAACLGLGILSQLERIAIALILPGRYCDIPSAYHAWRIRQGKPIVRHRLFHGDVFLEP